MDQPQKDRGSELTQLFKDLLHKEMNKEMNKVIDKKYDERKVAGDWYLFEPGVDNLIDFVFLEQPYVAGMLKEALSADGIDPLEFMREKGWKVTKVSVYREE